MKHDCQEAGEVACKLWIVCIHFTKNVSDFHSVHKWSLVSVLFSGLWINPAVFLVHWWIVRHIQPQKMKNVQQHFLEAILKSLVSSKDIFYHMIQKSWMLMKSEVIIWLFFPFRWAQSLTINCVKVDTVTILKESRKGSWNVVFLCFSSICANLLLVNHLLLQ